MQYFYCFYLLLSFGVFPELLAELFDNFQSLGKHILLEWSYDEEMLAFKLTTSQNGWIGVGFSPDGSKPGSDVIMTGVSDGRGYVLDAYAVTHVVPDLDEEQNVQILYSKEENGQTEIALMRKLDTGDSMDMKIKKGPMHVIWALGKWDISGSPGLSDYHFWNSGSILMELIPKQAPEKYITNPIRSLSNEVSLEWQYSQENIMFKITSSTHGWIGLGLSPNGTMAGADMMISGEKSGQCYVFDVFARSNEVPTVDESKDVEVLQCKRENHYLTVLLKRKLKSADSFHDLNVEEGDMTLIWAYGNWDIWDVPRFYNYHFGNRGATTIRLIRSLYDDEKEISDTEVPEKETTNIDVETDGTMTIFSSSAALSDEVMLEWFTNATYIVFKLTAPTLGWVGLGFSPTGTMKNADLILAGERSNEIDVREPYVLDAYAEDNETPIVQESQDVTLRLAIENRTHTTVIFERLLDTGDSLDMKIEDKIMNILYAYGREDIMTVPVLASYHGTNRGLKRLNLLSSSESSF